MIRWTRTGRVVGSMFVLLLLGAGCGLAGWIEAGCDGYC
jgi:hypothetical protein